jgi:DNA-binding NtrC family response regulator
LSPEAERAVLAHAWPGNVRELQHVIERAVLLARGEELGVDSFPRALAQPSTAAGPQFGPTVLTMRELQRQYAAWALVQLQGHKRHTCEALQLDLKTLNRLLTEK